MKIVGYLTVFSVLFCGGYLKAHVKKQEGLFYQQARHALKKKKKKRQQDVEKTIDGQTKSAVALIHGLKSFNQLVIERSFQQPVVVKLFSQQSLDSIKVKPVYQAVAESLRKDVAFAAMDVIENNDVFVQLMAASNLSQVALPLFLFYKDGRLYTPSHEPSSMVQGYLTKENLESFIKHKFTLNGHL